MMVEIPALHCDHVSAVTRRHLYGAMMSWRASLTRRIGGTVLSRRHARYGLAGIRIVNGALGLVAPQVLIKRLDPDSEPSPAAIYAFRLFGIRTIWLGVDLLIRPNAEVQRALRQGVVIHTSDVVTAVLLGVEHKVPKRTAIVTALISTTNVALALAALERRP
jgi:hypothetical protein